MWPWVTFLTSFLLKATKEQFSALSFFWPESLLEVLPYQVCDIFHLSCYLPIPKHRKIELSYSLQTIFSQFNLTSWPIIPTFHLLESLFQRKYTKKYIFFIIIFTTTATNYTPWLYNSLLVMRYKHSRVHTTEKNMRMFQNMLSLPKQPQNQINR